MYDTSSQPLSQILSQVQRMARVLWLVGCLKITLKSCLEQRPAERAGTEPAGEYREPTVNISYFALSPEDEARDVARHIRNKGKQAPLVLIPRSSLAIASPMRLRRSGRTGRRHRSATKIWFHQRITRGC
ncbi:penicillin-binding protein activator [Escherichia coli]